MLDIKLKNVLTKDEVDFLLNSSPSYEHLLNTPFVLLTISNFQELYAYVGSTSMTEFLSIFYYRYEQNRDKKLNDLLKQSQPENVINIIKNLNKDYDEK